MLAARNVDPLRAAAPADQALLRRCARRRHADLGAHLDQRRRPWPVRRGARDRHLGFRRARQAVCGDHRIGRPEAKPEGVRAAGGRGSAEVRFGLLPQVLPVIAGQMLYFIESNTRSATIIGVVGAGGIGLYLSEQIRVLEWRQVSFLILLILCLGRRDRFRLRRLRAAIAGRRVAAA